MNLLRRAADVAVVSCSHIVAGDQIVLTCVVVVVGLFASALALWCEGCDARRLVLRFSGMSSSSSADVKMKSTQYGLVEY